MRPPSTDDDRSIASLVGDPSAWRDLMSLSRRRRDDREILQRLLHGWAASRRVDRAALYVHSDGVARLLAVADGPSAREANEASTEPSEARRAKPCPDEIAVVDDPEGAEPHDDALDGWSRVDLPSATLLHCGSHDLDPDDPELLLLAAAARISALKSQIQKHSFQAMFRGVELEVLYEVGLAIASTLDLEELGSEVLLRAVSLLDARRGALYLSDADDSGSDNQVFALSHSLGGEAQASIDIDLIDVDPLEAGRVGDGEGDLLPGARHLLGAPIEVEGATRGLIVVGDKESRQGVGPFPPDDRRTLALFASQAAIALENARLHRYALERERLEREMELAAEIQGQLLPDALPDVAGYEVVGWNRPARHVGGDYFGYQLLADGRWSFVVGDVSGKGVPAALLVSTLHSALSVLLELHEVGPELVSQLNRHVCESSSANKFITLFMAVLEPATGRLTYLNAGHNPAVIVRPDDSIVELPAGGLPIGLMPEASYVAQSERLGADDLLCIYSDGITECAARDEEEYELHRLEDLLRAQRGRPLGDILTRIDEAMIDFADGQPQGDDQTVVLVRRSG